MHRYKSMVFVLILSISLTITLKLQAQDCPDPEKPVVCDTDPDFFVIFDKDKISEECVLKLEVQTCEDCTIKSGRVLNPNESGWKGSGNTFFLDISENKADSHFGKFQGKMACKGGGEDKGDLITWRGTACTEDCEEKDVAEKARNLKSEIKRITKEWDTTSDIAGIVLPEPNVNLEDITAKGRVCDCCDGTKNGFISAELGGPMKFTLNKDLTKNVDRFNQEKGNNNSNNKDGNNQNGGNDDDSFDIKFNGKKKFGLSFTLDASSQLSGKLKKLCGEELCVDAKGSSLEGNLTAEVTLQLPDVMVQLGKDLGKYLPSGVPASFGIPIKTKFSFGRVKGGVKGSFSVDSCGSYTRVQGDICAKPIKSGLEEKSEKIPNKTFISGTRFTDPVTLKTVENAIEDQIDGNINIVGEKIVLFESREFTLWSGNCN